MKQLLLTALFFGSATLSNALYIQDSAFIQNETTSMNEYCDGWADGFCEGWKDVKGPYAICPATPICPTPEIGKDRYKDGYNRGFKAGSVKAFKKQL